MISCAAIQKLERYGYLGLKRHSTEDFVSTSIKDAKRVNVYALTLLETWKEAVQAIRGTPATHSSVHANHREQEASQAVLAESAVIAAPARFTDALVYALSFAVALTTQHVLEVATAEDVKVKSPQKSQATSGLFPDAYTSALALLKTLKEMGLAISSGRALRSNASSEDFTKAVAHLLANVLDLVLILLATLPEKSTCNAEGNRNQMRRDHEELLAQGLVLVASVAQMLRRVQASYPVTDLYNTRPCAALLKQVANKHKQQQKSNGSSNKSPNMTATVDSLQTRSATHPREPLFDLLHQYVWVCAAAAPTSISAASFFAAFSLFQRLSMLHGALSAVRSSSVTVSAATNPSSAVAASTDVVDGFPEALCSASAEVQHWLSQLLSATACNRATRYVVYFREDELRLMQHNIRQASEYALYTFTTTPPVDPGLVESLLGAESAETRDAPQKFDSGAAKAVERNVSIHQSTDAVTHARAALVLAQWCVSAPFFFESFCQDETWASFAQEQRRLVLLQQSRARRGLERTSKSKKKERRGSISSADAIGDGDVASRSNSSGRSSSVSSQTSDTTSVHSSASQSQHARLQRGSLGDADTASLLSFQTASHADHNSIGGSVTSLASRVSLLSTFSKHSAASYLSFLSVLRPSTAGGSVVNGGRGAGPHEDGGADEGAAGGAAERQLHESEDGNTNLPLILLEQLTLGLHRFMESYPVALLDAYGLRSISWSCIARMFAFVEASLMNQSAAKRLKRAAGVSGSFTAAGAVRNGITGLQQPLFNLAQDIRYNKGMGYECLGLLFAKAVAPLLDANHGSAVKSAPAQKQIAAHTEGNDKSSSSSSSEGDEEMSDVDSHVKAGKQQKDSSNKDDNNEEDAATSDMRSADGDRTEEGFFANAAALAASSVGRANLKPSDDAVTRHNVEAALSTCLTAYETVAPQVVDMNLATILRLAARTPAAAATKAVAPAGAATSTQSRGEEAWTGVATAPAMSASLTGVLVPFLQDITRRLGRNNELSHLVDALLGRGEAGGAVQMLHTTDNGENSSSADERATSAAFEEELLNLRALRCVFRLPRVRRALIEASGMSLDPESLLLHLTSIASELEENLLEQLQAAPVENVDGDRDEENNDTSSSNSSGSDGENEAAKGARQHQPSASRAQITATVQRTLLTLEVMEAVLEGVVPTSVSASAVLEQTTQLELLLTSSFMKCIDTTTTLLLRVPRSIVVQHACTIRQCRAVTALCLQDLGSQQVQEYLLMLDETLWQLSTDIGQLVGTLTIAELQPLLESPEDDAATTHHDEAQRQSLSGLLLPSLVLQRLSLARAVTAALGTTAGPAVQLHDMVAYIWGCIRGEDKNRRADGSQGDAMRAGDYLSLMLANQMSPEDWVSVVSLGKEKHARAAMMALLARSSSFASLSSNAHAGVASAVDVAFRSTVLLDTAWLSCCLRCIPGTALRALVDLYVTFSMEELCDDFDAATASSAAAAVRLGEQSRRWCALLTALTGAYAVVGHNPYWPSMLTHSVRSLSHLTRAWRKLHKQAAASESTNSLPPLLCGLAEQLLELILCVVRSEPRAQEILRKALLQQMQSSSPPALSRSGLSVAYVESIKVPAAVLSDLAAPAAGETSNESAEEQIAALSALSFDDELRELCELLFHQSFAKHLLTLGSLATSAQEGRTGISTASTATQELSMRTLAFLYQVSLAATQTAWRARLTGGSQSALRATAAVVFLETVSELLLSRVHVETTAAALTAFLEPFHTSAEAPYLFVHIAAAKARGGASGEKKAEKKNQEEESEQEREEAGALDAVEQNWYDIFCHFARAAVTALTADSAKAAHVVQADAQCDVFRAVFAQLLLTVQHKQHQMSKSGGHGNAGSLLSAGKRARRGGGAATAESEAKVEKNKTNEVAVLLGVSANGVTDFLKDVLLRQPRRASSASVHKVPAAQLCEDIVTFFETYATSAAAVTSASESAACAWWLLWKLFTVAATLNTVTSAAAEGASAMQKGDILHIYQNVTTSFAAESEVAAVAAATTTLRACSRVLRVLPAEAVPALLLDQIQRVMLHVIPAPAALAPTAPGSPAIPAAAELLLQLFRVRPRLPAWRLLPHAQRLLVWLTHGASRTPSSGSSSNSSSGPSLCQLGIRLCAAVTAHPLVFAAPAQTRRPSTSSSSSSSSFPHAAELLDNVWLLLLSLLQGSTRRVAAAAPSSVANAGSSSVGEGEDMKESEVLQVITLLTKTWLRGRPQPQLWSRPALLPPLMCALFTCVMRGMASGRYTPRVLNVLAGGLAAVAADVDAATAAAASEDAESGSSSEDEDDDNDVAVSASGAAAGAVKSAAQDGKRRASATNAARRARTETVETGKLQPHAKVVPATPQVSASLQRMALAATTAALFEVAQHHVHVFTSFSSDMDFLFTDFLRVLSQHFLPTVTRPPIAYHAGVHIAGSKRSDMTFADLAYMCVGNAESKSLLKQAAQRMDEEEGGAAGALGLTDGSRSIFHVA